MANRRTTEGARNARPDVLVVNQTRTGKGNALACGFEAATGDVIAMLDADGSTDPGEIPRFVETLVAGADFAKGTRFASDGLRVVRTMLAEGGGGPAPVPALLPPKTGLSPHRVRTIRGA